MTTAITMKTTIGALNGLISYCNNKKMTLAKIKCHVDNIGFLELRGNACFAHAYGLTVTANNCRSFSAMAHAIQCIITEIERAIDAAHDEALTEDAEVNEWNEVKTTFTAGEMEYLHGEALKMDEVISQQIVKFKYGSDHFQALINIRNESHNAIVKAGYDLGWKCRDMLKAIRATWNQGMKAMEAHKAAMAERLAAAPKFADYDIPF